MQLTRKKIQPVMSIRIFLIAILIVAVILPLFFIFGSLGTVDIGTVVASNQFLQSLLNSISVGLTATLISMGFAFLLSFLLSRSGIRFKGVLTVAFTIPMLIPSISHGMGLVVLFGKNGIFTNLFGMESDIYGFWGVVLGSCMYAFPVAFLMFNDIFKYEDRSVYVAANILGIKKSRQLIGITMPYLKKPLISIFFATFTLIFTDYGVAMMVGGRFTTLPLYMYNQVIGQLNFGIGAVVALVLIVPAICATLFDIFNKDSSNLTSANRSMSLTPKRNLKIATHIICWIGLALVLMPIVLFSIIGFIKKYPIDLSLVFDNLLKTFNMGAGQFLINSLIISIFVSIIGCVVSYFTAYLTARTNSKINRFLHLISLVSLAIPGVVLGISYSLMYGGSFMMGTLAMLIIVNIVHFFSSPYLMCYNALNKVNKNYEIVIKTLRISKIRFVKDVLLPETFETIVEMASYFFVNCMITISAVSFIATTGNMPLSLLINRLEAQNLIESIAIVSLIILAVNMCIKSIVYLLKRMRSIKNAK